MVKYNLLQPRNTSTEARRGRHEGNREMENINIDVGGEEYQLEARLTVIWHLTFLLAMTYMTCSDEKSDETGPQPQAADDIDINIDIQVVWIHMSVCLFSHSFSLNQGLNSKSLACLDPHPTFTRCEQEGLCVSA